MLEPAPFFALVIESTQRACGRSGSDGPLIAAELHGDLATRRGRSLQRRGPTVGRKRAASALTRALYSLPALHFKGAKFHVKSSERLGLTHTKHGPPYSHAHATPVPTLYIPRMPAAWESVTNRFSIGHLSARTLRRNVQGQDHGSLVSISSLATAYLHMESCHVIHLFRGAGPFATSSQLC